MNKSVIRISILIIVIFTGIYLFAQSFQVGFDISRFNRFEPVSTVTRFPDDYFQYTSTSWHYDNPTNLTYPHTRFNAAFYTFVKNDRDSLGKLRRTIRNLEDQFNKNHHYPYIIFSDEELDDEYKELVSALTESTLRFEKVEKDLYGYEPTTDLKKAEKARISLNNTMFGDSEDYRFQSRFMAGTIFR